jgi:hypothetical protein
VIVSRICAVIYFAFFALLPLVARVEKTKPLPTTIGKGR